MKAQSHAGFSGAHLELIAASDMAARSIPPLWPLASSVAVNPFLGQAGLDLAQVSGLLMRVGGIRVTMPNDWYRARIADGRITTNDLLAALSNAAAPTPQSVEGLKAAANVPDAVPEPLPTVAHLAQKASGIDWPGLIEDRIGTWAAGYFDTGQALWQVTPGKNAFESWQNFASRDLTPEIAGLTGFAATVAGLPARAHTALALACDDIGVSPDQTATYFHQLLSSLGGWGQVARYRLWQAEQTGRTDPITTDMLTIRLIWEQALMKQYQQQIASRWITSLATHATPARPDAAQIAACMLQEAAERGAQRALARILAMPAQTTPVRRPVLQAVFCIDVRSEVFRRALENIDPDIQTVGFAGFFGLALAHRDFASDVDEARLPVLMNPGLHSTATGPNQSHADQAARFRSRAERAWGRFKLAAVSSFAFVEATGPVYVVKLVRDALGLAPASKQTAVQPRFSAEFALPHRIATAATVLRAMSLTEGFAPLVLLLGHGASVVNNPHASALHCGACGGYRGDVNARLLAGLLNDPEVRDGLPEAGITIPEDTLFMSGLHETTTDQVTVFAADAGAAIAKAPLDQMKAWLADAGALARAERALRLPRADAGDTVATRSSDWAETRPEWALAGCSVFIAAPRDRTRGKPLAGRAFLHDYDWRKDDGFGVLELILTAPVMVASWISLQYYGSVVAPDVFGAGNKLLHNVTGGIGVVEGNGGNLRSGLPWQSVHDGAEFAHEPLRLSVCIQAPAGAVADVLARHDGVRDLFDNRWLTLFVLDSEGRISLRYAGDLDWEPFEAEPEAIKGGIMA